MVIAGYSARGDLERAPGGLESQAILSVMAGTGKVLMLPNRRSGTARTRSLDCKWVAGLAPHLCGGR